MHSGEHDGRGETPLSEFLRRDEPDSAEARLELLLVNVPPEHASELVASLRASGFQPVTRHVSGIDELRAALRARHFDAALLFVPADGSPLPAVELTRQLDPDMPLVVLASSAEQAGLESMRAGAHDYVGLHELARLGPALRRELREAELRRNHARAMAALEEAQAVAHVGSWLSGLGPRDRIEWSAETYRIFGVPRDEPITVERFFSVVHPDDRERVRHASREAIDGGTPYDITHRIVLPNGKIRYIHERACVIRDGAGKPLRMVGSARDVTEQLRTEERERFLAQASAEMARSLDYPGILDTVAHTALPKLADGALVDVLEGNTRRSVLMHSSPERTVSAPHDLVLRVVRSGRAELLVQQSSEIPRRLGARAVICVPLRARGRIFGAITLLRDPKSPEYDAFDLTTAEDFAHRAAFAIDNARLYRDAQESVRARDAFLSITAHELKTPITPLKLQTRSLLRQIERVPNGQIEPRALKARLSAVERAASRLEELITGLLDLSQLTVGRLVLERREVDLVDVVMGVLRRMQAQIEHAACDLSLDAPGPVVGWWDRNRLEQVVRQLVANAIKYGAGGPIELVVAGDASTATLSIRDRGIGIALEDQQRIFERFERVAPIEHYGGFGLGLWSVRRIVEAHGGHIDVWSRPEQGALFTIELPRAAPASFGAGA